MGGVIPRCFGAVNPPHIEQALDAGESWKTDRRGACLCGGVKFSVVAAPRDAGNASMCHCGQCRRWGGGAERLTGAEYEARVAGEKSAGA